MLLLALISCADAPTADTDDVSSDTGTNAEITADTTETEPDTTEAQNDTTDTVTEPDTDETESDPESDFLSAIGDEFVFDPEKYVVRIYEVEKKYFYHADDTSDTLTALVNAYLADGSGYDELYETVFFQFVCAANLYTDITYSGMTPYYYNVETERLAYELAIKGPYDYYRMARYGEMDTWREYLFGIPGIFGEDLASLLLSEQYAIEYNGYVFSRQGSQVINWGLRDPEFSIEVKEDLIILTSVRLEYDYWVDNTKLTGNTYTDYYILKKMPNTKRWLWVYMGDGYRDLIEEYEKLISEK